MYEDEFEEILEDDEADMLGRRVRPSRRDRRYHSGRIRRIRPGRQYRSIARTGVTGLYSGPVGPKPTCPPGQVATQVRAISGGRPEWTCIPATKPHQFHGRPVDDKNLRTTIEDLKRRIRASCNSRSRGKGITWGDIPPEILRIPFHQRLGMIAGICGKKKALMKRSPIADKLVRMMRTKLAKINKQIGELEKQRVETEKAINDMARPPPRG